MNYLEIDFNNVKGFNKLTSDQQGLFINTYKVHNSCHGLDYKADWAPISVEWIKREKGRQGYLKVIFRNGKWLHYTQKGDWY